MGSPGESSSRATPPPPVPDKELIQHPVSSGSIRDPFNSLVPIPTSVHLGKQRSTSSSSSVAQQQTPLTSRRTVRSSFCPSSSRPSVSTSALDSSQDHHRSDSGRSSGSSRSTATTDSFFVPQHPHTLNRRLKDLPNPPSSTNLADSAWQAPDTPPSALGLNISVGSALPSSRLSRSKSSVSTTPTSPEEGAESPLDIPAPGEFPDLDEDVSKLKTKLISDQRIDLDDFWKSDYSYARPSAELQGTSLPPLLRSNTPIPPSRSQSLDPCAAPLDEPRRNAGTDHAHEDRSNPDHQEQLLGARAPLVAANLRKLDSQNLQAEKALTSQYKTSSPSLSPVPSRSSATRQSDSNNRLEVPTISPYQPSTASANSSRSAIDIRSPPNKSNSSLSTSSAIEGHDKASGAASTRSSQSSASSFRVSLSKQAMSLRSSFLRSAPTASPAAKSSDSQSGPISQPSSPARAETSPSSASSGPSSPLVEGQKQHTVRVSPRVSTSFIPNTPHSASSNKTPNALHRSSYGSREASPASRPSIDASFRKSTDLSQAEDRPKSRLPSRLMLHNTSWSMKLPHLKAKKAAEATSGKSRSLSMVDDAGTRSTARRSKSTAGLNLTDAAATSSPASTVNRKEGASYSTVPHSKGMDPLVIPRSTLLNGDSCADSQLSPTFAETFAFLNSHIDSSEPSPTAVATVLQANKNSTASTSSGKQQATSAPTVRRSNKDLRATASELPSARTTASHAQGEVIGSRVDRGVKHRTSKDSLFDQLANSPVAVHKTLALPASEALPVSQSLDNVAPKSDRNSKRFGHRKQASLGSASLISKSATEAAANLDKRARGAPVSPSGRPSLAGGRFSTRSSFSSALPNITPVDEETRFFDALTSPWSEQPPAIGSGPSSDDSVLPSSATAAAFLTYSKTEPSSPVLARPSASASTTFFAASLSSAAPKRLSLGRRLSGVFDASRTQSTRKFLISPPQSPEAVRGTPDGLPARPETSLGFHLRNPLRREAKMSEFTASPQPSPPARPGTAAEVKRPASSMKSATPTSTIRRLSGFRLERDGAAKDEPKRPGTSLGFTTSIPGATKIRSFSNSVLAPTKSSLARSVQRSPPSNTQVPAKPVSSSSLSSPEANRQRRSPSRTPNPPSSFRGSVKPSLSRPSLFPNGSPDRTTDANSATALSMLPLRKDSLEKPRSALRSSPERGDPFRIQADEGGELSAYSTATGLQRRRSLSRPVLRPIRTSLAIDAPLACPSSAMGVRSTTSATDRKKSQPTLDMVDDREFLEALEQVRQLHRDRIRAQAQEVEHKARLARLGMLSGNHLQTKISESLLDGEKPPVRRVNSSGDQSGSATTSAVATDGGPVPQLPPGRRLRHKRSSSADAILGRSRTVSSASWDSDRDLDQRQKEILRAYTDKKSPVGPPTSGLEWGVGKASGKLHDGTFVNDDDWKKEVKALFLIRELVQTERSYARHLDSLLDVVRNMQTPIGLAVKRKSATNLFAAYSATYTSRTSAASTPPSHIHLLRTYLPQLIALSSALVQKVEENPTSAGVGAAFDTLAAQVETTFVGWSGVAAQALKDLRTTELSKGKSPFKIGLVPLAPRESSEVGASTLDGSNSSGASSPGSGLRHSTLRMTSLTRPSSPVRKELEVITASEGAGATLPAKRSMKRRSTITSTSFVEPPTVTVEPASADHSNAVQVPPRSGSNDHSPTESSQASSFATRLISHSRSQSTLVSPLLTPTSAHVGDPWSLLRMTSSTASSSTQAARASGKSLTPMDIAIMPTQRIPRYGLMLRDLLRNTPPESLSHARVLRAIALLQRVASLCDSAAPVPTTGSLSGAATPSRASSVLGTASAEVSPLLSSSAFAMTKRT